MSKKDPKDEGAIYGDLGLQVLVKDGVAKSLPTAEEEESSVYGNPDSQVLVSKKDGRILAEASAEPIYGDHPATAEPIYGDSPAAARAEPTKPLRERVAALSRYFKISKEERFPTYTIGQNQYCFDNPICDAMILKSDAFTPLRAQEDILKLEKLIENTELRAKIEDNLAPSEYVAKGDAQSPLYDMGAFKVRFDSQTYPNEIVFGEIESGANLTFKPISEAQREQIKLKISEITNAPPRPPKPSAPAAQRERRLTVGDDSGQRTLVSAPDPTGSVKNAEAAAAKAARTKNNPFFSQ